ncbi:LysR family transcriptional regulator, partial [Acinetobacter baumannii]|nr:LysR family transcriptional regulator [Acinetobacter baumannii]
VLVKGEPLTRDTYLAYDENVVMLPQVSAFKALINEFISE